MKKFIENNFYPNNISFDSLFLKLLKTKPNVTKVINIKLPIALYGAGNFIELSTALFKKVNLDYEFIIDKYKKGHLTVNNKKKEIKNSRDINEDIKENYLIVICISTYPYYKLHNQLLKDGFKNICHIYEIASIFSEIQPLNNNWRKINFSKNEISTVKSLINLFYDQKSKANYLQFLYWHYANKDIIFDFAKINCNNRFIISDVLKEIYENNLSIIDCGSYKGEVLEKFFNVFQNRINNYFMFDADKNYINYSKKIKKIKKYEKLNIEFFNVALGKKKELKKFYSNFGYASQISNLGETYVEVLDLDSFKLKPNIIKIHTEGNELDVLKGSLKTISNYRPVLMLTAYHNEDGLVKIPKFLFSKLKNYKIICRLHGWFGTGLVYYCIPKSEKNL